MDVKLPSGKVIKGIPEGTPKEVIQQKAIDAGLATPEDFAEQTGAAVQPTTPRQMVTESTPENRESGLFDIFTGAGKTTRDIERTPSLLESGILSDAPVSAIAKIAPLLSVTNDPNEMAEIITANVPGTRLTYNKDAQGNIYPVVVNQEGQSAIIDKPGIDALNLGQLASQIAAFTPAARVAGASGRQLLKGALAAGATQAGIEATQTAAGGEFNPEDVALEAGMQVGGQALESGAKVMAPKVKEFVSPLIDKVRERFAGAASREAPYEDVAKKITSGKAERAIPEIMADPEVIKAAEDLGINVNPGVYSKSDIYREMENSLKILPGSQLSANEKQTVRDLAQRADELITEYTGTTDKSAISEDFTERMLGTVRELEDKGDAIYKQLNDAIPASLQVRPKSTMAYIGSRIEDLGGAEKLDTKTRSIFQRIQSRASDEPGRYRLAGRPAVSTVAEKQPTYALLDSIRKDVGSALTGKGPFRDASLGELKQLYRTLTEDTMRAAELFGLVDEANLAKETVRKRIALQDQLQGALGKDLSKSLMSELGMGVRKLQRGDPGKFEKVMQSVPEPEREMVAISALNNVLAGGAQTSQAFSLGGFVNAYEGLQRNPRAANKLFQHIPDDAKKRLDSIYKVSKGLVELNRKDLANPSGTARAVLGGLDAPEGIFSRMYKAAKQGGAGAAMTSPFDAGTGAALGIFNALRSVKTKATQKADQMLSSPEFRESLKMYMRGRKKVSNRILSRTKPAQDWIKEQPPEVKRSIARQGLVQYLIAGEQEEPQGEDE